jgi:hypothetical protein
MYHYIDKNNIALNLYSLKELLRQNRHSVISKCFEGMVPMKDSLCSAIIFQRKTAVWVFSWILACFTMVFSAFSQEPLPESFQKKLREFQFQLNQELRDRENAIQRVKNEIAKVDDMLNSLDSSSEQFSKLQKKRRDMIQEFQALEREREDFKEVRLKQMKQVELRAREDQARLLLAKNAPSRSEAFKGKLEELKSEYGLSPSGAIQYIDFGGRYTPKYYCIWTCRNNLWIKLSENSRGPDGINFEIMICWPHSENLEFTSCNFFYSGNEKFTKNIDLKEINELNNAINKFIVWEKKIKEEKIDYKFSKDLSENYVFVFDSQEAVIAKKRHMNTGVQLDLIAKKEHIDDVKFVIDNIPEILTSFEKTLKQRDELKKTMQDKLDSILK